MQWDTSVHFSRKGLFDHRRRGLRTEYWMRTHTNRPQTVTEIGEGWDRENFRCSGNWYSTWCRQVSWASELTTPTTSDDADHCWQLVGYPSNSSQPNSFYLVITLKLSTGPLLLHHSKDKTSQRVKIQSQFQRAAAWLRPPWIHQC